MSLTLLCGSPLLRSRKVWLYRSVNKFPLLKLGSENMSETMTITKRPNISTLNYFLSLMTKTQRAAIRKLTPATIIIDD